MNKNFLLIGAAGYIAPRHIKAIKDTGNNLLAVLDPHDAVGILDKYFIDVKYFREFERFDRYAEKTRHNGIKIDYVSICSPNYLHDAHIRFGLRIGSDIICEKPLVINPWNCDALGLLEQQYNHKIYSVLQVRYHPSIIELKNRIDSEDPHVKHSVDLVYKTFRGPWYHNSWKGDENKSGGIMMNIGIHFFDMLLWIFGPCKDFHLTKYTPSSACGYLELTRANVKWELSIDLNDLPEQNRKMNLKTHRVLSVDGKQMEFSDGFTDLHCEVYKHIINGNGYGLTDSYPAIKLVYDLKESRKV